MNHEQRLNRLERILTTAIVVGSRRMRALDEKISILIDAQIRTADGFRELKAMSRETDRQLKDVARRFKETARRFAETDQLARRNDERFAKLADSQSLTDNKLDSN